MRRTATKNPAVPASPDERQRAKAVTPAGRGSRRARRVCARDVSSSRDEQRAEEVSRRAGRADTAERGRALGRETDARATWQYANGFAEIRRLGAMRARVAGRLLPVPAGSRSGDDKRGNSQMVPKVGLEPTRF